MERDFRQDNLVTSLYLHFPFCRHLCNYCDFYKKIAGSSEEIDQYERWLQEAFVIHRQLMHDAGVEWSKLETVYIGGGTPSLWGVRGAKFLSSFFKQNGIELSSNCEFTLEVNPGSFTQEAIDAFCDSGVNRFSIGLQSLDVQILKNLDRVHSAQDGLNAMEFFSSRQYSYSLDFMLGLPQKIYNRKITQELEQVLKYGPQHLSLYILTTKDNYPAKAMLPQEEMVAREYHEICSYLKAHAFEHYEVSNFSLPGKASAHNKKYWQAQNVAALGPSATGFFQTPDGAKRYKWKTKSPELEIEDLTYEELKLEKIYLSLRTQEGIDYQRFFTQEELRHKFDACVTPWLDKGLAHFPREGHFALNSQGMLFLDSFMGDLFKFL